MICECGKVFLDGPDLPYFFQDFSEFLWARVLTYSLRFLNRKRFRPDFLCFLLAAFSINLFSHGPVSVPRSLFLISALKLLERVGSEAIYDRIEGV